MPATAPSRSLRLEKGYRAWGADIGPDHSPLMAGLGWAVKLEIEHAVPRPRGARGAGGASRCPACSPASPTDPDVVLLGRETIYRDGKRVGWLASGGYGYTVGRSIGFGYVRDPENGVDRDNVLSGHYELEVATRARAGRGLPRAALRSRRWRASRAEPGPSFMR